MPTQYTMRATQISTSKTVYWVVTGAPDTTGTQSGITTSDLTNIATDYTSQVTASTVGGSTAPSAVGTRVPLDSYDMFCWSLDEDVGSTSFANTGITSGNPMSVVSGTVTAGRNGLIGNNAVNFNSTSAHIRTNVLGVNPSNNQLTIHGWCRPRNAQGAAAYARLIAKWYDSTGIAPTYEAFTLVVRENGTNVYTQGYFGAGQTFTFTGDSADKLIIGQWNHVAVTFDNGVIKLYINGNLSKTDTVGSTTIGFNGASGGYWSLGGLPSAGGSFDGDLDDWRVCSGIVRSEAYIRNVYRSGVGYGVQGNQIASQVVLSDGYANLPLAGTAGRLFLPTDGFSIYRDNGTSWNSFGPVFPLTPPPLASNWTLRQTASNGTLIDNSGSLLLSATNRSTGTQDHVIADLPAIATPYTVTAGFLPGIVASSIANHYPVCGILVYETSSGKFLDFAYYGNSTTGDSIRLERTAYTSLTANGSAPSDDRSCMGLSSMSWFRVKDDGTTRFWYISTDGQNWVLFTSEARGSGFTTAPNRYGIVVSAFNEPASLRLVSWKVTTP